MRGSPHFLLERDRCETNDLSITRYVARRADLYPQAVSDQYVAESVLDTDSIQWYVSTTDEERADTLELIVQQRLPPVLEDVEHLVRQNPNKE